jgi:hypothetical protein
MRITKVNIKNISNENPTMTGVCHETLTSFVIDDMSFPLDYYSYIDIVAAS